MENYQDRCARWADTAFGAGLWESPHQRCARFFEEALELCQALSMSKKDAADVIKGIGRETPLALFLTASAQFCGAHEMTLGEMNLLLDYVYDRPIGEPAQEVGGVMVTLALACRLFRRQMKETEVFRCLVRIVGLSDSWRFGERELDRVNNPETIEKIRRKHASKPKAGPLPGSDTPTETPGGVL